MLAKENRRYLKSVSFALTVYSVAFKHWFEMSNELTLFLGKEILFIPKGACSSPDIIGLVPVMSGSLEGVLG